MNEIKTVKVDELSKPAQRLVLKAFRPDATKTFEDRFACYAGQAFTSEMLRRKGYVADSIRFDARCKITFAFTGDDGDGLVVYNDNSLQVGINPAREIWTDVLEFKTRHAETFLTLSEDRTTPRYIQDFDFYCNSMMSYMHELKFADECLSAAV